METIDEIRRANLRELAREYGGIAQLASRLHKSQAQISQWINGSKDSKTQRPRGMRAESARWIETQLLKPRGWLDSSHNKHQVQAPTGHYSAGPSYPQTILLEALQAIDTEVDRIEQTWLTRVPHAIRYALLIEVLAVWPEQSPWHDKAWLLTRITTLAQASRSRTVGATSTTT
ncbi:hypothetical protein [Parvibium lacunae]|uniref:Helix-turn-helix domain-containing protein n=1 Tax=Parvibium lacunae TaxID=1888893 RepID=A0A368KZS0_9BURK|nr:hypothetical protein [Parvibium lacunae]RCS56793.1 hypothetical protein DU000_10660 [Parvibium lacunae]